MCPWDLRLRIKRKRIAYAFAVPPALRPPEHAANPALQTPPRDSPQTTRGTGLRRTDPPPRHKRCAAEAAGFGCCVRRSPQNAPGLRQSIAAQSAVPLTRMLL